MSSSFSPRRLLSLLLLLANTTLSAKTLDQLKAVPSGWTQTNVPAATQEIVLQIALTLQNIDQLEPRLASASTPGGSGYGQYLDIDDINSFFGASDESKDAVTSWLQDNGVTSITPQGNSIWIKTTVDKANSLLGTEFKTYTDEVGAKKVRTTQYSVPDELANHIDLVAPTTYFGKSKAARYGGKKAAAANLAKRAAAPRDAMGNLVRRAAVPPACNQTITYEGRVFPAFTPECLKEQYNIGSYTPDPKYGASIAFSSFLNQSASFSDLTLYEQHFGIPVQNFSVVLVNPDQGATDQPQPPSNANDDEANLDVQNIVGLTHPMPVTEYITAGSPPYIPDPVEPAGTPNENEPYLPYYEFLLSQPNGQLPQVISNSYGDEEQTVPQNYAVRVCNLIGLMGLRGISVLESSGDEGVGASCLASDGSAPQFNPIFPATCPYVTAIGGTVSWNPEVAWSGSSGGFSYYFQRPWYQEFAVGGYLAEYVSDATKDYYSSYVDFGGRGFPDVAAHSVAPDYEVFQGGVITPSGGTSAASPVTASIIALLNDARFKKGLPSLGFLNPLIYFWAYQGFTDITTGSSMGCDGNNTQTGMPVPGAGVIPGAFWNATPGWDPVTGFGVPNFGKLKSLVGA